jgi:Na+/proline symporter
LGFVVATFLIFNPLILCFLRLMSPLFSIGIISVYFAALIAIAYMTSRNADSNDFFTANKQAPWYLVAFGMIGASISGVTFISVPGAVGSSQFAYFQIVLGYLAGCT